MNAGDSLGYRIEALRLYLESVLGDVPFIAAYKHLVNITTEENVEENELEGLLGKKGMKFVSLIHQLIVCEDSYYANKNDGYH